MVFRIIYIVISTFLIFGCSESKHDSRLLHISEILADSPESALRRLDSIDYSTLKPSDRHFFDLLSIKAKDKANVIHTSDSLILDVINWYESRPESELYPEALYYGGKVYCELGDMPTALRYYRHALHLLPAGTNNDSLRDSVLHRTKILLRDFSMYGGVIPAEKAVPSIEIMPYIKHSLHTDKLLEDTVLNQLLHNLISGCKALRDSNHNEAARHFRSSKRINTDLNEETLVLIRRFQESEITIDSILSSKNIPASASDLLKSNLLAFAARLCQTSGLTDTEMLHSGNLLAQHGDIDQDAGFRMLLSPELSEVVSRDSLLSYILGYHYFRLTHDNDIENIAGSVDDDIYSYSLFEKDRRKTEALNKTLIFVGIAILYLVMIMAILILYMKNRRKATLLKLLDSIDHIKILKERIDKGDCGNSTAADTADVAAEWLPEASPSLDTMAGLREELKKKLLSIYKMNPNAPLSPVILNAPAFQVLQEKICDGKILRDDDLLWNELEEAVELASPDFKSNLRLPTGGKLTTTDLHTALLVKCHVLPSQMSSLLGRTKGAIVSRRESLCMRVFDEKMGTKVIDGIIRLL